MLQVSHILVLSQSDFVDTSVQSALSEQAGRRLGSMAAVRSALVKLLG